MITPSHEIDPGAHGFALHRKRVGIRDSGSRNQIGTGYRVSAQHCPTQHASELGNPEARNRHRAAVYCALHPLHDSHGGLEPSAFARDDYQVRPPQGAPPFTPWPRRQRPGNGPPRFSADNRDIEIAIHIQPLIRVIEYQNVGSARGSRSGTAQAVRIFDHDGAWYSVSVDKAFVATVSTQYDARRTSLTRVVSRYPGCYWCLARATYGEVPNRNSGKRQGFMVYQATAVSPCPRGGQSAYQQRWWDQRQTRNTRWQRPTGPQPTRHQHSADS
jgi:hypothetical protein